MTRHPVKVDQLPTDLRDVAHWTRAAASTGRRASTRAEVFRRFREALEPLRSAGKLGGILMQFPPYVVYRPPSFEYLEWAQEQLGGDEMLVEFRHASWLDEENRAHTLRFLEEHGMTYVVVDAPADRRRRTSSPPSSPPRTTRPTSAFTAATPRPGTKRTGSAAERFDYLYSEDELREWVAAAARASQARRRPSTRCSTTTAARRCRRRPCPRRSENEKGRFCRPGAHERADAEAAFCFSSRTIIV